MTRHGLLSFLVDCLTTSGLFSGLVADRPLRYASPNAPRNPDLLGTAMLWMPAAEKCYAHLAAVRGDGVLRELLDMKKMVSEDAVDEKEGAARLLDHLVFFAEPLLAEPWVLDVDMTIKPLCGHPEGARLRYNPKKPGRPSHRYPTCSMASTRLVLDVDVSPGDEHTSKLGAPGLWSLIGRLPRNLWPALLRGDSGFGNQRVMREAEVRGVPYLFKCRLPRSEKRRRSTNTRFSSPRSMLVESFGQLNRDRGDGENIFDEMKNHWAGAASRPRIWRAAGRRRGSTRISHDWWNILVRLVDPNRHRAAVTCRPGFCPQSPCAPAMLDIRRSA